ncbi:hypothetical protein MSG28_008289 [Choristoneura fumiferana]|uniref:Uncharacterized protein n=1 Tax=Choristoneura fumiferana TaxID=7141 RepID=A0ACC0JAW6_CHOFU|nr:hypothetical protein MSG28_008289 [Choristoneura fumiferana]
MEGKNSEKISFEAALDKAGFGLYSYLNTLLAGFAIIAMSCLVYGATFIVPASACELQTTGAQQGLLVAAPVVGLILGGPLWGYLGDTRGRRRMLLISLFSSALINAISALSVNWIMLMILQFISSLVASAAYSLSVTLLSESVPMAKRNLAVLMVSSLFMLAQGVMAVLAIPINPLTFSYHVPGLDIYWNSWRLLVMSYSLPSLVCADSPKFALVKGDEKKALKILKTIHRINYGKGAVLDVQFLIPEISQRALGLSKKDQIVPLFKAPLLKITIIMSILFISGSFLAWLPTIANRVMRMYETGEVDELTLCGIINADVDMNIDPNATPCALDPISLLFVLGVGVAQSVFNGFLTLVSSSLFFKPEILIEVVVNRAGRRNTMMVVVPVLGLCGILVNLVTNTIGTLILFGGFLLGYIVMGWYTAMAVALFPTQSNGSRPNDNGWQHHQLRRHSDRQLHAD